MPPKVDVTTLIAKRDSTIDSFYDVLEEFNVLFEVQPVINILENVYKEVEIKYRSLKKQQETIADKLCEISTEGTEELMQANRELREKVKAHFLNCSEKFATYQKAWSVKNSSVEHNALDVMAEAVTKMAEVLGSQKNINQGLEKLSVPTWDGNRKTYATWKREFKYWMIKYKQDDDEQLQRLRKALPKNSFWSDQVKPSTTIEQAWKILDTEFGDERKLMDTLLNEITNLRPVKSDSFSLSRYASRIQSFVNNMEQNGCPVTSSSEAPFVMSQLLSKLDGNDNVEFGREMQRTGKGENVSNLIDWLLNEASLRSRIKRETNYHRSNSGVRSDNHANDSETNTDEKCPFGCEIGHLLSACPTYQKADVNRRWEIVKQNNRCRKCLRAHHTNTCKKPDGTTCNKCTRRHHRSLHNEDTSTRESRQNPENASTSNASQEACNFNIQGKRSVLTICPVQMVKIKDKDGNYIEVLAMLDSGSNTSFISKNVARKLGISGSKTHLTMNLAGGRKKSEESELIDLAVSSTMKQSVQKSMQAYTINKPCSSARTVSRTALESYPHLKPIINDLYLSGGTVDLLIGTDFADAFNDMHVIPGKSGEPIAKRNCFGWYVIGPFASAMNQQSTGICSVDVGTVSVLEDMKKLLTQDLLGVRPTELCTCRDSELQENKFIKSISESTELVDGRVQVRMPWKEDGPPNESNFDAAYKRMISSEKSFKKKNCTERIDSEVQKLVELDFISEIPSSDVNHNHPEWYLPLQVVFTPERTTQVRLVFDASAKGPKGKSLNDYLEKGPNYINSLLNVLMAWRYDNVAYTGDVRKMFNQVMIHPEDQVFHRFLWRPNENEIPRVYQWKRLNFGDKPAPDIAAGAINTLAKASQDRFPEAAEELRKHVYVDDIGGSKENEERSKRITKEIDSILATGCFQIKEWNSNNQNIDQSGRTVVDFLGHKWNKVKDTISFKKNEITSSEGPITKRNCLAYLAQLWDPIGLVTPTTIELRIDLQELWSLGYSWDEILPDVIQLKWKMNVQVLNQLLKYEFSRKLKPDDAVELPEIHGFCDAGEKAYGSVLFLRWKLTNGTYTCTPILVKTFVSPLKKKSIPRLELMGCLSLARIYKTCKEALEFAGISNCKRMFWIDSQIVLSWLKTCPRKFKPFVSVRVAEIQETIDPEELHFIKSSHNPADALTKGITPEALEDWLKGPKFLRKPEEEWPAFKERSPNIEGKGLSETDYVQVAVTESFDEFVQDPVSQTQAAKNPIMEHLMKSCSSFRKARKVMAYVLRFISNARKQGKIRGVILLRELSQAELWLFKWSQQTLDKDKLDKKLIPSVDEQGLLRAHGRLENIRSLPNELRNPIILPKGHRLVHLLLDHLHEKRAHCGSKSLIYESRRRFWIIGVRHMAKHLTAKCVTCKKLRRKPLEQLMGQLPKLRVAVGFPAFHNTAIDMFGPLRIRVGRKTLKEANAVLFTCMTTRAIHLELVTDRSTDTFLMAFRRFTSLRGNPNNCWSDRGTNFIGAQHYLKETIQEWDIPKIQSAVCEEFSCTFHWNWNVPKASHQNGVVESLIKSVRRALEVSSKTQVLTEEQWRTFLAQVTCLVNQRPLYPSSNDIWEGPPVTPNDLLIGNHFPAPVPEEQSKVNPRDLVRSTEKRVQEFWHCWMKYFAPDLLPRNKWYRKRENLREGDLVLEMEPTPRRTWRMAVVLETFPGDDGLVRKAKIKTANAVYDRPIHKLCLIATKEELDNQN